jgi:hypothetical protein
MQSIDDQLDRLIIYLRGYRQLLKAPDTAGLDSREDLENKIKPLFVDLMGYGATLKAKEEEERGRIDERLRALINQRIDEKAMEERHSAIVDEVASIKNVIRAIPKTNPGERDIKANLRQVEKGLKKVEKNIKELSRKSVNVNLVESETMNELERLRKQIDVAGNREEENRK